MSTRQLRSATRAKVATAQSNGHSGGLNLKQSKPAEPPGEKEKATTKTKKIEAPPKARAIKRPHSPQAYQKDGNAEGSPSQNTAAPSNQDSIDKPITLKRQKLNKYPSGTTPFPDHPHPTPQEVQTVVDLLSGLHGVHTRPPKPPLPDLLVTGCGEVPSVLDAVIRTLLSASTSAENSNRAFKGLVEKFGVCGKRGSVDWDKVRKATTGEVFQAIKSGGLANIKSKRIKRILEQVWEEAQTRKKESKEKEEIKKQEGDDKSDIGDVAEDAVITRISTGDVVKQEYHGHQLVTQPTDDDGTNSPHTTITPDTAYESDDDLSLDYLHSLPDDAVMDKLTTFDGIGFKTASCVLLFCMSRDSFAVDTHVFRIARFLNWVPPDKANRETAFWHLDAKLPNEHKYALHQLFIKHGRTCKWCKAGGPLRYEDYGKKQRGKKIKREEIKKEEIKREEIEKEEIKKEEIKREEIEREEIKKEEEEEEIKKEEIKKEEIKREEIEREEIKKEEEEEEIKKEEIKKEEKEEDGTRSARESGSEGSDQDEAIPPMCPIEHLVKRFHGASKGRGAKWEE